MNQEIDELSVQWKEDGVLKIKELRREIFPSGNWATGIFLYQELQGEGESARFSEPKVSLRRYRRRGGRYQVHSKFVLSSAQQARQVAAILNGWFPQGQTPDDGPEEDNESERHLDAPVIKS